MTRAEGMADAILHDESDLRKATEASLFAKAPRDSFNPSSPKCTKDQWDAMIGGIEDTIAKQQGSLEKQTEAFKRAFQKETDILSFKNDRIQTATWATISHGFQSNPRASTQDLTCKAFSNAEDRTSQVFTSTQTLLTSAESLLGIHSDLMRQIEVNRDGYSHADTWEDDQTRLKNVLEKQARMVKHEITRRSCRSNHAFGTEEEASRPEEDVDLDILFRLPPLRTDEGIPCRLEESWISGATRIKQGIKKLVKHLPED